MTRVLRITGRKAYADFVAEFGTAIRTDRTIDEIRHEYETVERWHDVKIIVVKESKLCKPKQKPF